MSIFTKTKQTLISIISGISFISLAFLPLEVFADLPVPDYRTNPPAGYVSTTLNESKQLEVDSGQELFITIPPQPLTNGTIFQPQSVLRIVNPVNGIIFKDFTPSSPSIGYRSDSGFNGDDLIVIQVRYSETIYKDLILHIDVTGSGTAPEEQSYTVEPNQPLEISLRQDQQLVSSINVDTAPTGNGSSLQPSVSNQNLIYIPGSGYSTDRFVYTVCYIPSNICNQRRVLITLNQSTENPPNNPTPSTITANDDTINFSNGEVIIPVLTNDRINTDVPVTISIPTQPSPGSAQVNEVNNTITYTNQQPLTSNINFNYQICQLPQGATQEACDNASITIVPVSTPPTPQVPLVAVNDVIESTQSRTLFNPLVNDTFPPEYPIRPNSFSVVTPPQLGTFTYNADTSQGAYVTQQTGVFSDSIRYRICNDNPNIEESLRCSEAVITINVNIETPTEPEPILEPVARQDEVTIFSLQPFSIYVLENDVNIPTESVSNVRVELIEPEPSKGTARVNNTTNQVEYIPNDSRNRELTHDTFGYRVCVNETCSESTITVRYSIPEREEAIIITRSDIVIIDQGIDNITINVLQNDETFPASNFDISTFKLLNEPNSGTATIPTGTTSIVYSPRPEFSGIEELQYEICDTFENCSNSLIRIIVEPTPPAPSPNTGTQTGTSPAINIQTQPNNQQTPTDQNQVKNTPKREGQVLGASETQEGTVRTGGNEFLSLVSTVAMSIIFSFGIFITIPTHTIKKDFSD